MISFIETNVQTRRHFVRDSGHTTILESQLSSELSMALASQIGVARDKVIPHPDCRNIPFSLTGEPGRKAG